MISRLRLRATTIGQPQSLMTAGFLTLALTLSLALPLSALAAPKRKAPAPLPPDAQAVDNATEKGLAYLLTQQAQDGRITDRPGNETAMTSLAIMAMAGLGHQPTDDTPHGRAMKTALEFVLRDDRQTADGYFGKADGSRMYGHGITTLMLAEMLGMGIDDKQDLIIRKRLQLAIDLILKSQKHKKAIQNKGGWRYEPGSNDSDLSVTVWQVMALRAAYNNGLDVPTSAVDEAVAYVRRCYDSPRNAQGQPANLLSAFAYIPGRNTEFSTAGEGLLAMQVCGQYEALEVKGAADWLLRNPAPESHSWFYYGTYYYAQGMYQRGGDHADAAAKRVPQVLLPKQKSDGGWDTSHDGSRGGRVYSTSLALLSLAVKHHFLPIYQR
ncbi:MAG: prenyltransferase/squalene oxidase repeat-containing protein [Phycisphaeraceae bacterium]